MPKPRFQSKSKLKKGPGGRWLCRCGCNVECQPPRRTFASDNCVHNYLLRTSNSYLRRCVRSRDKGICVECKLDCIKLRRQLRAALKAGDQTVVAALKQQYPRLKPNRSYWEADHIVEVVNGGGCCGLENLRTVCVECHLKKTIALNKQLRKQKKL
ncbi:MAG: HNH endonuclease [Nitrosomonadaceae bacterium]|nr:HNH endonuclease [Nitrosomonadaceae bacterium]